MAHYSDRWAGILSGWNSTNTEDRVWLTYAANYLFRTAGVRWALDPFTLPARLPETPVVDVAQSLRRLSFVVLSHAHADHLDLGLLRAIKDLPIRFVIPEFMLPVVMEQVGIPEEKIIHPIPNRALELDGIVLTPFGGLHWEKDASYLNGLRGVPAMGYLVEFGGKRWLFPGDTRQYDASQLPDFGPVDGLVVHVWLGRGCALQAEPALLGPFCKFCLDLRPGKIILSHLDEFGRHAPECWDDRHARMIIRHLGRIEPQVEVMIAHTGERFTL